MITEAEIQSHLNSLAKPAGSLGRLEELAARLCRIQQTLQLQTGPRRTVLFAADHGVTAEGVSIWPAEVTSLMMDTIIEGKAASSVLAKSTGTELRLIDVGSSGDSFQDGSVHRSLRVRLGSRNLATEPALTLTEFQKAIAIGEQQALEADRDGMKVVAAGEMGIGNTTSASCLTAFLTGAPVEDTIGAGAGANESTFERKSRIVKAAVARAQETSWNSLEAAIASICGLEIAAMAGFFRQAAICRLTIILDGFIATSSALISETLWPGTTNFMIAAHESAEPGHKIAFNKLGLNPMLAGWNMRLGEGTGALLLMPLLDAAAAIVTEMATLDQIGIRIHEK